LFGTRFVPIDLAQVVLLLENKVSVDLVDEKVFSDIRRLKYKRSSKFVIKLSEFVKKKLKAFKILGMLIKRI